MQQVAIFQRRNVIKNAICNVYILLVKDVVSTPLSSSFHDTNIRVLINPGNNRLIGTSLSYFPIGGPVPDDPPPDLNRTSWGGMEAGGNHLYRSQVVDGRVHELGGENLRLALRSLPVVGIEKGKVIRCKDGDAVITLSFGKLLECFTHIVHTVPPFYSSPHWKDTLSACYMNSISLAFESCETVPSIVCPILGSGARGIPMDDAVREAVNAVQSFRYSKDIPPSFSLSFAVLDAAVMVTPFIFTSCAL